MISQNEGKEMWLKCADADGWISKDTSAVINELEITGYDDEKEAEESLNLAMNYYDIEFENEKEERWKFI